MDNIKIFFDKYSVDNLLYYNNFKALLLMIFNNNFQNIIHKVEIKLNYTYDEVINIITSLITTIPCIVQVKDIKNELIKDFSNDDISFIISKIYGKVSDDDIVDASKLNTFTKMF